jgi:response regulator of citrate/malate metabolism
MTNQQIREVLESLVKERKEHPPVKLISQEKLDKLINSYYKTQASKEKRN